MRAHCWLLTLVIAAASCSSCVIIPIPTPGRVASYSRGRLTNGSLAFLEEGRTTQEEVLLKLGEPDRAWREERLFVYDWEPEPFWVVAGAPGGGGGAAPVHLRVHFLLLEFDGTGLLKRRQPGDFSVLSKYFRTAGRNPAARRSLGLQREIAEW